MIKDNKRVSKQKKWKRAGKYVNKDVKTPSDEKGTSLDELLNEEKQDW